MLTIFHCNGNPDVAFAIKDDFLASTIRLLPQKLREEVSDIMKMVAQAGASHFWYNKFQIGIPEVSQNNDLDFSAKQIETMFYLDWWLGPHIYCVTPGRIGSDLICNDCGRIQPRGVRMNNRCQFQDCISHMHWERIINGYVPQSVDSMIAQGAERAVALIDPYGIIRR